ncbi:DUF6020 family protein [Pleomorphochaeta sp. DL1XJH-081]|uniref:DUF6020 family protein n=1 Tax=Pleomorphochaeta sp. DL1XJH-081 TaxID=3409690 RepID=UPI003BB76006
MKSIILKRIVYFVISSLGFWLFITNFGLVNVPIAGWNNYSRISQILYDLGVYGYRSELIPTILFLLVFFFVYFLYRISENIILEAQYLRHINVIILCFSLLIIVGNIAAKSSYIFAGPFRSLLFLASLLKFFGLFSVFGKTLIVIYNFLLNNDPRFKIVNDDRNSYEIQYLKILAIIIVGWVPYIILNFPGVVTTDGFYQLRQVTGLAQLTDHHPVLHTALLAFTYRLSSLFDLGNTATIFLYVLIQTVILSNIYAFTIYWLKNKGINKAILVTTLFYFSVLPIHAYNATVLSKDFLSAGFLLLTVLWLYDYVASGRVRMKKFWKISGFFILIITGLLRNNVYYAIILTVLILSVLVIMKKFTFPKIDAVFFIAVLCVLLSKGMLLESLDIPKSPQTESLSIPVQQIARTIDINNDIPEELHADITKYFSLEEVKLLYDPYISDPVKFRIADRGGDFHSVLKIWSKLGVKNPLIYLDSFIFSNFGYWYPQINFSSVLFPSDELIYNDHDIAIPFGGYGAYVSAFIVQFFQFIPGINLLTGIGFMFILLIIAFDMLLLKYGIRSVLIVYIPLLLSFFTLIIAAPMTGSHRYAHFLFVTMPVFILIPFIYNDRG